MESLSLLLLLLFPTVSGKSHVQPRGLLELAGAVKCAPNHVALLYVGYGCYCGMGGTDWPLDQADRCCQKQDCCYDKVEKAACGLKTERYQWDCTDHRVECGANQNTCEEMICKCDQEFAHCLAKSEYKNIFFPHFLCGNKKPECD